MTPDEDDDRPPRQGTRVVVMALLAMALVVASTATALAAGVLLQVDGFKPKPDEVLPDIPEVAEAKPGKPRTILLLGSDARYADAKAGVRPRSDTILLVRVDPQTQVISAMSIPRDLKAEIPGHGSDKINAAYEMGGPRLTVRTIRKLFEDATGDPFTINNVVNVDFRGFRRAVDYIGGVYVDVDRDYFNDVTGPGGYAAIDIDPGYQKLEGQDALDYVRYRHTDNDFVRAARQQSFLRQARGQRGVRRLVSIGDTAKLMRVFRRYFTVDKSFRSTKQILRMAKLGLYLVMGDPSVQQVRFRADYAPDAALDTRLYASADQLRATLRQFLGARRAPKRRRPRRRRPGRRASASARSRPPPRGSSTPARRGSTRPCSRSRSCASPSTSRGCGSRRARYAEAGPRTYTIRDEKGDRHRAYRLVLSTGTDGEYYGIQGMTWTDPPILDDPDETRTIAGRRLQLYRDGRAIRIVAFKTRRAVYWVSNTLTSSLTNRQMLATAQSLTRLERG